jgi:hypothetical protein
MTLVELRQHWLAEAAHLRPFNGGAAHAFEQCARELEELERTTENEVLTLEQAAKVSGYHADSLRHKIAAGELPNAGRKGAPRVRRKDLPRRVHGASQSGYDPLSDALRLVSGPGAA